MWKCENVIKNDNETANKQSVIGYKFINIFDLPVLKKSGFMDFISKDCNIYQCKIALKKIFIMYLFSNLGRKINSAILYQYAKMHWYEQMYFIWGLIFGVNLTNNIKRMLLTIKAASYIFKEPSFSAAGVGLSKIESFR